MVSQKKERSEELTSLLYRNIANFKLESSFDV